MKFTPALRALLVALVAGSIGVFFTGALASNTTPAPTTSPSDAFPPTILESKFVLEITCDGIDKPIRFRVDPKSDEVGETPKPEPDGEFLGGRWLADRWLPLLIKKGLTSTKNAPLELKFTAENSDKSHRLYATDTTAAVYAIQHLVPENLQTKWLDAICPIDKPKDPPVKEIDMQGAYNIQIALNEVAADTPDLKAAAAEGMRIYNDRRPEFLRKFGKSFLFYPPMDEPPKIMFQNKTDVVMIEAASDLMYAQQIFITLKKDNAGKWTCTEIRGGEFFKGE